MSTAVPVRSPDGRWLAMGAAVDDGWAILASRPASATSARPSCGAARSPARSAAAPPRRRAAGLRKGTGARVSAALVAATLVAPAAAGRPGPDATAAAAATAPLLKKGSRGAAVAAAQSALGIPADGVFGPPDAPRGHGLPARARPRAPTA